MLRILAIISGRPHLMKAAALHVGLEHFKDVELILCDLQTDWPASDAASIKQLGIDTLRWIKRPASVHGPSHFDHDTLSFVVDKIESTHAHAMVVFGDLDGTAIGTLAAKIAGLPVIHIEAGLRSHDNRESEEHNRVIIDVMADNHSTHKLGAANRIIQSGTTAESVHLGSNPISCLFDIHAEKIITQSQRPLQASYALSTIHRTENLKNKEVLVELLSALQTIAKDQPIILITYDSLKKALRKHNLQLADYTSSNLHSVDSLDYHSYIRHLVHADYIITDSSSLLDEAVSQNKRCVIMRNESHRDLHHTPSVILGGLGAQSIVHAWNQVKTVKVPVNTAAQRSKNAHIGLAKLGHFVYTTILRQSFATKLMGFDISAHPLWRNLTESNIEVVLGEHDLTGVAQTDKLACAATSQDKDKPRLISEGIARSVLTISELAHSKLDARSLTTTMDRDFQLKDGQRNLIVLGSEANNTAPAHIMDALRSKHNIPYRIRWNDQDKVVQIHGPQGAVYSPSKTKYAHTSTDYALVVLTHSDGYTTVLVSGCHMWGTQSSMAALADEVWLLQQKELFQDDITNTAIILEVTVVGGRYEYPPVVREVLHF